MGLEVIKRAARRRWAAILMTVVSGLAVASVAHPDWGSRDYAATHTLYSPAAGRAPTQGDAPLVDPFLLKPEAIAALATSEQTATAVAADLGFDGEPLRLFERVQAVADSRAGTIAITARRRDDPRIAVLLADSVGDHLVALVDGARGAARQRAIADAIAQGDAAEATRLTNAAATSGISTIKPAVAQDVTGNGLDTWSPFNGWLATLLLLGALGLGVAVAAELTDDRIADQAAAVGATELRLLAAVPLDEASDDVKHASYREMLDEWRSWTGWGGPRAASDSSFAVPSVAAAGGRVVLFAAPTSAEDTEETVIGFAEAVAATGRSALIIDCDDAGAPADGPGGLSELAATGVIPPNLRSLVRPTTMARVSLVPCGSGDASAATFLVRHPHFVQSARELADVVILHGPGITDNEATPGLVGLADETVLVCRAATTQLAAARQAATSLRDSGVSAALLVAQRGAGQAVPSLRPATVADRVRNDSRLRNRVEWVGAAVVMLVLYGVLRSFVFESYGIPTPSMAPYLDPGDHVLVSKLSYRLHGVHRGDVIVFDAPTTAAAVAGKKLIKRVIALPGDTIEGKDGHVYVNGRRLPEKYLNKSVVTEGLKFQKLPSGRYWVMGDNRTNSGDSRVFGAIKEGAIVGRAFFHIWPMPIGFM